MKKTIVYILALQFLFSLSAAFAQNTKASTEQNNPIEKAFAKDFETASATAEINYVNELYLDAWKTEMKNISEMIKKSYQYPEDIKRLEDYLAGYENLIQKAFDLEMLNYMDTEVPVAERSFGTGGPGAAMLAEARLYKQETFNLIEHYKTLTGQEEYSFVFNGKIADIEKLRKDNSG